MSHLRIGLDADKIVPGVPAAPGTPSAVELVDPAPPAVGPGSSAGAPPYLPLGAARPTIDTTVDL